MAAGTSLAYVQAQLGHASITQTVDTYGKHLPLRAPGAVDSLAQSVTGTLGLRVDTSKALEAAQSR